MIDLDRLDLGPLSLLAPPPQEIQHVVGTYGQMWQWVGDGAELHTMAVAVRETQLGNPTGVRHHLQWEIDHLPGLDRETDQEPVVTRIRLDVEGTEGTAAADVVGVAYGADVRHRVVVTTDGEHMHVTRVLVPATAAGRELVDRITSSLRIHPWSMDR